MTLEDQVLFQIFDIKGYDFETSQNEAHFKAKKDEVDPEYLSTPNVQNLENKQALQED